MSLPITEQFGQIRAGNVFTAFSLAQQAFSGIEELVGLNLAFVRELLPDSQSAAELIRSDKTPIERWLDQINGIRPFAEKVLVHNRHAFDIAMRNHAAILDIINAQFQQQQLELRDAVEGLEKNAPAGSEAAVSVLKSAVSLSGASLETIRKTAAQVIAMAQKGQFGSNPVGQLN